MAVISSTEAFEVMRLQRATEEWRHFGGAKPRVAARLMLHGYLLARRLAKPVYDRGVERGWEWLPRVKDRLRRRLVGIL
jgi:hypothetical protein